MRVRTDLQVPDIDAALDLQRWLDEDRRLPLGTDVSWAAGTSESSQGAMEILQVVVDAAALVQFVKVVFDWKRSVSPEPDPVVVLIPLPDGSSAAVTSDDPDAVAEVLRKLSES